MTARGDAAGSVHAEVDARRLIVQEHVGKLTDPARGVANDRLSAVRIPARTRSRMRRDPALRQPTRALFVLSASYLQPDGHFVLRCEHTAGHGVPPPMGDDDPLATALHFVRNHPYWIDQGESPLLAGLPPFYPQYCIAL